MNKLIYCSLILCIFFIDCKTEKKPVNPIAPNINLLSGTWQNVISPKPDFTIEQDSILFLQEEPAQKYKINLVEDSLTIRFPSFNYTFKVSCYAGDSIHLENEMNSSTFLKVK